MRNPTKSHKKAPWVSLGVFFCALLPAPPAITACVLGGDDELVALDRVLDGDTPGLVDGRRVRLIGVNAPELAMRTRAAEPLAGEARQFAERFLAGDNLGLVYDHKRRDRHRRLLAHVYNHNGDNLESALLSAGLAFHVAIAPNLSLAECLAGREDRARAADREIGRKVYGR